VSTTTARLSVLIPIALFPGKPLERLKKGEMSPWLSTSELQDVCGDEYLI
jgi:hypothetical protein